MAQHDASWSRAGQRQTQRKIPTKKNVPQCADLLLCYTAALDCYLSAMLHEHIAARLTQWAIILQHPSWAAQLNGKQFRMI